MAIEAVQEPISTRSITLCFLSQPNNHESSNDKTEVTFSPDASSISVGTNPAANVQCPPNPSIDWMHGTIECTPQHHIWVYIDHSKRGSILHDTNLYYQAKVIEDNTILQLGTFQLHISLTEPSNQRDLTSTPLFSPVQRKRQSVPHIHVQSNATSYKPPPLQYATSPRSTFVRPPEPQTAFPKAAKSQRDQLRIQVSKRAAGSYPSKAPFRPATPQRKSQVLDFTPPSSPVAQQVLLKQKKSLQDILRHRNDEEEALKQQQEEWMRQEFELYDDTYRDSMPEMTPVLERTTSIGLATSPSRTTRSTFSQHSSSRDTSVEELQDFSAYEAETQEHHLTTFTRDRDDSILDTMPVDSSFEENELQDRRLAIADPAGCELTYDS